MYYYQNEATLHLMCLCICLFLCLVIILILFITLFSLTVLFCLHCLLLLSALLHICLKWLIFLKLANAPSNTRHSLSLCILLQYRHFFMFYVYAICFDFAYVHHFFLLVLSCHIPCFLECCIM